MDNNSVNEAIEILINNFTSHPRLSNNDSKLNVFDLLQEFWQLKLSGNFNLLNENSATSQNDNTSSTCESQKQKTNSTNIVNILYEFLETPSPPYICFVTLPNEACFATFQNTNTKLEARRSAALISLMNSIFNEHPLRKINEEFINKSIENLQKDSINSCNLSIDLYKRLLEICKNKTFLEFKQMMTVFQLLQWNGSLKAMRERNCLLDEVISFYKNFKIDEKMRSQMSLDWIAREQHEPGIILKELHKVNGEIDHARLNGRELRFLKEKRDILLLASYQFDIEINSV